MTDVQIEPLAAADRPAAHALLAAARLPRLGFDAPHVMALVAKDGVAVVGSAALEIYGRYGLLRSVAVAASCRGQAVGARLTDAIIAHARAEGLVAIYLLTETAAAYFPRFGFAPIARDCVPAAVQQSIEFTTACPASAAAFSLFL